MRFLLMEAGLAVLVFGLLQETPMRRLRAFTLVELLVVIGIVTLLIALLMPALTKARAMAQAIVCASNLRQFATGLALYANDFKGATPFGAAGVNPYPGDSNGFAADWLGQHFEATMNDPLNTTTNLYVRKNNKVWQCPASSPDFASMSPPPDRHYSRIRNTNRTPSFVKMSVISALSDSAILYDAQVFSYPWGQISGHALRDNTGGLCSLDNRHTGGANFLFLDGHVQWFDDQLTDAGYAKLFRLFWGPP